jgi:hypothetical protein
MDLDAVLDLVSHGQAHTVPARSSCICTPTFRILATTISPRPVRTALTRIPGRWFPPPGKIVPSCRQGSCSWEVRCLAGEHPGDVDEAAGDGGGLVGGQERGRGRYLGQPG